MYRIIQTREFKSWVDGLRDRKARLKIEQRMLRCEAGLLGDWKSLGDGVTEMRVDYGPGYRLYFTLRGEELIILLCGSEKDDQRRAIARAKEMVKQV